MNLTSFVLVPSIVYVRSFNVSRRLIHVICHTFIENFSELSYQRAGRSPRTYYVPGWRANSVGLLAVTSGNKLAFLAFHNSMMMVLSFPMTPLPFGESNQCIPTPLSLSYDCLNTPKSHTCCTRSFALSFFSSLVDCKKIRTKSISTAFSLVKDLNTSEGSIKTSQILALCRHTK